MAASQAFDGRLDLGRGHAQAGGVDVEPVELFGRLEQGGVAARGHVIDDGAGGALDIGRNLALGGEELLESRAEIGAAGIQANGHGGFLRDVEGPCSMARRPRAVNPLRPGNRTVPAVARQPHPEEPRSGVSKDEWHQSGLHGSRRRKGASPRD